MTLNEIKKIALDIKRRFNRHVSIMFLGDFYQFDELQKLFETDNDINIDDNYDSLFIKKDENEKILLFKNDFTEFEPLETNVSGFTIIEIIADCNYSGVYDQSGIHMTGLQSGRYDGGWDCIEDIIRYLNSNGNKKIMVTFAGEL